MQDTVNGSARTRVWPRKRGRGGTKAQKDNRDKFMNAQRATKYFAPGMYQHFMKQVEDSPLLPRDAMTMMLYNRLYAFILPSGKVLWPMPAYQDVSQSLDVISNEPGMTMFRGPDGWQAVMAPGPSAATRWTFLKDVPVVDDEQYLDIKDIGGFNEYWIIVRNVGSNSSNRRALHLSTDNGNSFFSTGSDYTYINPNGTEVSVTEIAMTTGNYSSPKSGIAMITGNYSGTYPMITVPAYEGKPNLFTGSIDPINAIRLLCNNGGTLVGGHVIVMGR